MSYTEKYKVDIPEGTSGAWEVAKFEVSREASEFDRLRGMFGGMGRYVPPGIYTGLTRGRSMIMSDTPDEIRDHLEPIRLVKRRVTLGGEVTCLVHGLGLGMVAEAMLKEGAHHVTVIDRSPDVISLVAPTLRERHGDRIEIIEADAFEWKPPKGARYGIVWHDIWDDLCTDNLSEMATLHRRYGRRCDWQGSWGKGLLKVRRRQEQRQHWW